MASWFGAEPLHDVVPRRVPQEGITDRRVEHAVVGGDLQIDGGDSIENRAEGVGARASPLRGRRRVRHEVVEVLRESSQLSEEQVALDEIVVTPENALRETEELGTGAAGAGCAQRFIQLRQQSKEIAVRGTAVDAVGRALVFDLGRVARGAAHAEVVAEETGVLHEADRQSVGIGRALRIRKIAETRQPVGEEKRFVGRAFQAQSPGVRHQLRSLRRRIKPLPVGIGPVLREVLRRGGERSRRKENEQRS